MLPNCGPVRTCRPPRPWQTTGVASRDPVHHVEVVDELLDVVVAREPREERPAADLPLHVAPRRLAVVVVPQLHVADPQRLEVGQLADLPVADPLHELEVLRRVALLGADDDGQPLLARPCRDASISVRTPTGSTAPGFSTNRCLPASTAAATISGRKPGRREQHDQVHVVEGEDLLVRVEAEEDALGRDLDLARDLLAQLRERRVDLVLEQVRDGDELDAGRGLQAVDGVHGAALAAADHGHADRVRAGGEDAGRGNGEAHPRRRHRLAELPARNGVARARRHDDLLDSRARARGAGARGARPIMSWPPSRYHPARRRTPFSPARRRCRSGRGTPRARSSESPASRAPRRGGPAGSRSRSAGARRGRGRGPSRRPRGEGPRPPRGAPRRRS